MKAFISYSHRDAEALNRLHVHLAMLRRDGLLEEWFDRDILAGGHIDAEVAAKIESSRIFLLLVSLELLNSDYCYNTDMTRALERHRSGDARVVPIIIEPCEWQSSPLRELKALPQDGKPVSDWTNQNNAYLNVTQELRRIVESEAKPKRLSNAAQAGASSATEETSQARRYRLKRDFDEIDRSEFLDTAFATIRKYFESAVAELDEIEDLRARFTTLSPTSFGCVIVNRGQARGTAHITVHRRSSGYVMGDIYYSFSEDAAANTANGGFSIEHDEFELFLTSRDFGYRGREEKLSAEAAAESLWTEFVQKAGVVYD